MTTDGVVTVKSAHDPWATMQRLEAAVTQHGLSVFASIDHAAGAASAGLELRPTALLIFGNARGGTPLMQAVQTMGLDLPLKVLVWQDRESNTWLSYDDPVWLAKRHGVGSEVVEATSRLKGTVDAIAREAASP